VLQDHQVVKGTFTEGQIGASTI